MGWFSNESKRQRTPAEQRAHVSSEESAEATDFLNRGSRDLRPSDQYGALAWLAKYQGMISKIPDYARAQSISNVLQNFKSNGYDLETRKPPGEEVRNKQDRADRLILLALQSIKDTGNVPPVFLKESQELVQEFSASEKISELVTKLNTIPKDDTNALLDWMQAYLETKGKSEDYALLKEDILRAFEEKGYRPFVEGDPTASADSPRTAIEQSLSGIRDYGVVPQFFEVKHRQFRGA